MPIKKYVRKAKKYVKRRYTKQGGGLRYKKMFNDIMKLKSIVNAEKKHVIKGSSGNLIGQVNENVSGHYIVDATPIVGQGSGEGQRNGDSIKLCTASFNLLFKQQTSNNIPIKGVIELYQVLGLPQTIGDITGRLYKPNAWIPSVPIYDLNSNVDSDYRQQYKLVMKRNFFVKADTSAGQQQITNLKIPIKFGKFGTHIKYDDGTNTVASGQMIMLIRVNGGNSSGTDSTISGGLTTATASTGIQLNSQIQYWFYDN